MVSLIACRALKAPLASGLDLRVSMNRCTAFMILRMCGVTCLRTLSAILPRRSDNMHSARSRSYVKSVLTEKLNERYTHSVVVRSKDRFYRDHEVGGGHDG